jgi:predicted nucleotidyltransferase
MNLSEPIRSVFPGAHGQVLQVLARTTKALTARQVAMLTEGTNDSGITKRRANDVLQELTEAGVVIRQDNAPSYLYSLNPDHVAAGPIAELANLREDLLDRIKGGIETWTWKPVAVFLFGSTAKGTATERSDIDLLVVPAAKSPADEWDDQLSVLSELIHRWSGNYCEILELTEPELLNSVNTANRLGADLFDHGRVLYGGDKANSILRRGRRTQSTGRVTYGDKTFEVKKVVDRPVPDEPNRPRLRAWDEDDS